MNHQQTEYLWPVKTRGGETVFVPADLDQMTTYVLLEQQDWFEEEISFVRKLAPLCSHMFDIGANHGVYSLAMAQANPTLRIQAFEPTIAARRLQLSVQHNNFGERFTVHPVALADKETELFFPDSPDTELNSASDDEQGIRVSALPLNSFIHERVDDKRIFVKLDVEGMEVSVIAGGHRLFREAQPIVMFELKNGLELNTVLPPLWKGLGYQIYHHIPGLDLLTPYTEDFQEDFLLNLFAIKPKTAQWLEQEGLLVTTLPSEISFKPTLDQLACSGNEYLRLLADQNDHSLDIQHPHDRAFALYAMALDSKQSAQTRLACLFKAGQVQYQPDDNADALSWLLLQLKVNMSLGQRSIALQRAHHALSLVKAGHIPARPYPSVIARPQDTPTPFGKTILLKAELQEFLLRFSTYSTYFSGQNPPYLSELLNNDAHSFHIKRVALLTTARNRTPIRLPANLSFFDSPHDSNAPILRRLAFGGLADEFSNLIAANPLRITDIGAASHGALSEPYASLLLAGCGKVYGFEPNVIECNKIEVLYQQQGWHAHFKPWFIGDGTQRTFYLTQEPQCCSLYEPNTPVLEEFDKLPELVQLQRTESVTTRRLDDVLEEGCDFLKMDIQGAELDVLKHAQKTLSGCLMIWLEVEFVPIYKGQPLFAEADTFLREHGFRFLCFDYFGQGRRQNATSQLSQTPQWHLQQLWADAIYIIDPSRWPNLDTAQLRKLAILFEMIGAGDHVLSILSLLDKEHPNLHHRYAQRYYLPGATFA